MSVRRFSPGQFAAIVIAAIAVPGVALFVAAKRNPTQEATTVPFLPALAGELNSVTGIEVRKGSATPSVTVHRSDSGWTVAERADYPADVGKVRKLLLSLRDAKIVEEKTADPARFAAIGLADPKAPGGDGIEISVIGPNFKHTVILGKPLGEGDFARRADENQAYAIEPAVSLETEPRFWIDSRLLDVPEALLQSVQVKPAAGPAYTVQRLNPADNTYALAAVPAGRKALDGHALAPGATTFGSLTAEDVAPATDIDFSKPSQAIVTESDGNVITLTGAVAGTRHWLELTSTKDAVLNQKAKGRAFEIASYRYDAIYKPLEQLLEPKETPAPKPAAPGPAAARPATSKPAASPALPKAAPPQASSPAAPKTAPATQP